MEKRKEETGSSVGSNPEILIRKFESFHKFCGKKSKSNDSNPKPRIYFLNNLHPR
jgi:hypothetical protein